ncbi:methylamine utilization protein [Planctobacterium marinum]|uniref:Methylamine utilization protein n=1 Tax=Planctobacterium marinum TaxID=1631968 RepID=A0AA48HPI2_9ALTE|nr:hypothetical protein MACH26_41120 [Planctobacterium marinum]
MHLTQSRRLRGSLQSLIFGASTILVTQSNAITLEVKQKSGEPAAGVVVLLEGDSISGENKSMAEMGQRDRQFDPHVLVVQKGSTVNFPNYDDIKHHIYSFSSVKTFEQELYEGTASTPVTFDKTGIVELGCNVHDWMLGYIYITETPYFGMTDEQGKLTIASAPAGEYEVTVWHPRMENDSHSYTAKMTVSDSAAVTLPTNVAEAEDSDFDLDFDDYE